MFGRYPLSTVSFNEELKDNISKALTQNGKGIL